MTTIQEKREFVENEFKKITDYNAITIIISTVRELDNDFDEIDLFNLILCINNADHLKIIENSDDLIDWIKTYIIDWLDYLDA